MPMDEWHMSTAVAEGEALAVLLCRSAATDAMRVRQVNKDTATTQRVAVIESQRRQLAARLAEEVAQKARHAHTVLQRHDENQQSRAMYFQVADRPNPACVTVILAGQPASMLLI